MKRNALFLLLLALAFFPPVASDAQADGKTAWVVPIEGEIDRALTAFVHRGIQEAEKAEAEVIIFPVDTFGGRVDSALQIATMIGSVAKAETIAYVPASPAGTGVSWSAGALISFSCKRIYMAPGTSIGAAAPVYQTPQGMEMAPEKAVSAVRTQLAALAEKNGYSKAIALAMVDADVELVEVFLDGVPGVSTASDLPELERQARDKGQRFEKGRVISPKGKLLTLTAGEAERYGVSRATVPSLEDLAGILDVKAGGLHRLSLSPSDRFVSFFTSPAVTIVLVLIGLVALYLEITTPGFGIPGTVAIICFAVVFLGNALLGTVGSLELILFLLGAVLLVVEIFLIPGFGVVGISGILLMLLGLILAQQAFIWPQLEWQWEIFLNNLRNIGLAFAGSLAAVFLLLRFFPRLTPFNRLILGSSEKSEEGYTVQNQRSSAALLGRQGTAVTTLRPSGKAEFDGEVLAVETDGEYVEAGSAVQIIEIDGNRIRVRRK